METVDSSVATDNYPSLSNTAGGAVPDLVKAMVQDQRQDQTQSVSVNINPSERQQELEKELQQEQQKFEKELQQEQQKFEKELQRKKLEYEKQLQKRKAADHRRTILLQAAEQRKTALASIEAQKILDNWPLILTPSQILSSYAGWSSACVPLRIIPVPPVLDFDKFGLTAQDFPKIEKYLAEGLRKFLHQNYPLNSHDRPVELLDRAWESSRYRGGSSITALFGMLKSEPVLILESEVDGDNLSFRFACWGLGEREYAYTPVVKLAYKEFVYKSVRERALEWKKKREELARKLDNKLEEIDALYGDNKAFNLKILEEEEKLQKLGITSKELDIEKKYKVDSQDFHDLCRFLLTCHCLLIGLVADTYHLIQSNVQPLLPKLLPQLLPNLADEVREEQVVRAIVSGYTKVYQTIEREQPSWIPELALQLANILKYLPDKSFAMAQVEYSVKSWLRLHDVTLAQKAKVLEFDAMKSVLMPEDWQYVDRICECLLEIGDTEAARQAKELLNPASKGQSYYRRALERAIHRDYLGALADYRKAISLVPELALVSFLKSYAEGKMSHDINGLLKKFRLSVFKGKAR